MCCGHNPGRQPAEPRHLASIEPTAGLGRPLRTSAAPLLASARCLSPTMSTCSAGTATCGASANSCSLASDRNPYCSRSRCPLSTATCWSTHSFVCSFAGSSRTQRARYQIAEPSSELERAALNVHARWTHATLDRDVAAAKSAFLLGGHRQNENRVSPCVHMSRCCVACALTSFSRGGGDKQGSTVVCNSYVSVIIRKSQSHAQSTRPGAHQLATNWAYLRFYDRFFCVSRCVLV